MSVKRGITHSELNWNHILRVRTGQSSHYKTDHERLNTVKCTKNFHLKGNHWGILVCTLCRKMRLSFRHFGGVLLKCLY